ncbi:IclR family transcriptional regulator [Polaromonas sp. YR568]|uniref:IclR family transcriptional regulator n=1 Tax=Polaromonas sp. YR568 TaxID=1855301 RepID=UPI00398BF60D
MKRETDHEAENSTGAQTVDRACELLREIARTGAGGVRILDLCHATGLSRPTAHRILRSLQLAGLVRQSPENRRYALGSGLFELGMAAPNPITQFPQVRSVAEELAASTEDTVYLMLRSYDDVLCAWRAQGAYPIKANVVALGDRRPMGASVAGLCLLAGLPEAESNALIAANAPYLPAFCRMTPADVTRHVNDARDKGYSVGVNAVMEGVTAVGMAVPASYQRPCMALSVSAISSRIPPERIPALVEQLKRSAARIAAITGSDAAAR